VAYLGSIGFSHDPLSPISNHLEVCHNQQVFKVKPYPRAADTVFSCADLFLLNKPESLCLLSEQILNIPEQKCVCAEIEKNGRQFDLILI
jgi:hypothetical protein